MLIPFLRSLRQGAGARDPAPPEPSPGAATARPALRYQRGGTIVAFVTASGGDALKQHTLEMLEPLRPHASRVAVIDMRDQDWRGEVEAATAEPVWFAMSSFGVGELDAHADGTATSRWAQAGVPFVRIFGDSPAYLPAKHLQHLPGSINAYGHAEHLEAYLRWFRPAAPAVWLPLYPFDVVARDAVDCDAKAAGAAIVFPKNGNDPERLRASWRSGLPPSIASALEALSEERLAVLDEDADLMALVLAHFERLSIDLSGYRHLVFFLAAQLDDFLRRAKSTLIARSLLDLPVTVRGSHWEHVDFDGRRAQRDTGSDYTATRGILDTALAIVDMTPNTQRGPHDRALRAAGRHTAFLTNRTSFYADNFTDAPAFTFRYEPDAVRACVEGALARPRETVERGFAQAARMRELLTRERYVEQLVTAVDAGVLGCGARPPDTPPYIDYRPLP